MIRECLFVLWYLYTNLYFSSMFAASSKPSPKVVVGAKRSAPVTPPLETRGAKGGLAKNRSESPCISSMIPYLFCLYLDLWSTGFRTKRSRLARSLEIDEVPAAEGDGDGEVSDSNNSTGQGSSKLLEATRYHNDPEIIVIKYVLGFYCYIVLHISQMVSPRKLPLICYVADRNNQDDYLKERGHYDNLPNLRWALYSYIFYCLWLIIIFFRKVEFIPYKPSPTKGLVKFERWENFISKFNKMCVIFSTHTDPGLYFRFLQCRRKGCCVREQWSIYQLVSHQSLGNLWYTWTWNLFESPLYNRIDPSHSRRFLPVFRDDVRILSLIAPS